jgi:hypothetical protein
MYVAMRGEQLCVFSEYQVAEFQVSEKRISKRHTYCRIDNFPNRGFVEHMYKLPNGKG